MYEPQMGCKNSVACQNCKDIVERDYVYITINGSRTGQECGKIKFLYAVQVLQLIEVKGFYLRKLSVKTGLLLFIF